MSGYFRRLAQRSGLGSGLGGQSQMAAQAKVVQPPIAEVEEVREASQPTNRIEREPTSSPRGTDHSHRESRTENPDKEFAPRFERTALSEPAPEQKTGRGDDNFVIDSQGTDTAGEPPMPPEFNPSETRPEARFPENIRVETSTQTTDERMRETAVYKEAYQDENPDRSAETVPSFIRDVETVKERERVTVRAEVAADTAPERSRSEPATAPGFPQSTVRIDPVPLEKSAPAEQPEPVEKDTGPRIQIGQIQVEVYAPPSPPALQAAPKPAPRPSRSTKADSRGSDLRRYYLRGF